MLITLHRLSTEWKMIIIGFYLRSRSIFISIVSISIGFSSR